MANPADIDQSIKSNDIKPISSDGFLVGLRIKAKNMNPKEVKPETATPVSGLLEITFVDESKQQALGRFLIDRTTADELSRALIETIKKFDEVMGKEGLTKLLPKSAKRDDSSYR